MATLRDGSMVEDPRFDRLIDFDARSLDYPVSLRLDAVDAPRTPITKTWDCPIVLDQGREGACVGNGFAHEAAADPVPVVGVTEAFAHDVIYWGAQRIDQFAGGSYPGAQPYSEGTSVLAGAKVMTKLGAYLGYHWCFSEPEVALAISYLGPVVLGLRWYSGMYRPNAAGFLRPTGTVVGGHCILARGYDAEQRSYLLHNSWGSAWGNHGTAKISAADLATLLKRQGEACVPEGRQIVTV